jgi:hypothetical protein
MGFAPPVRPKEAAAAGLAGGWERAEYRRLGRLRARDSVPEQLGAGGGAGPSPRSSHLSPLKEEE